MTEKEKDSDLSESEKVQNEISTIPVIEEFVQVEKGNIITAKVRIDKKIKEEEVKLEVPIEHEELEVERIPINQYIEGPAPKFRQEGETTIIPVLREVVEKRLVLVEELRLTKRKVQEKETKTVKLRKEEVTVERTEEPLPDFRKE